MKLNRYLKTRYPLLLLWLGVLLLLLVGNLLYELPLAAVLYPMSLSLLPMLGCMIWDYRRERRLWEQLEALKQQVNTLLRELEEVNRKTDRRMEYYSVWAHQVKTPLAAMRLLLQSRDTELSHTLEVEVKRIESYADMVMTYLRLDSDSTDYVFESCPVDEMIKSAVRSFSGEFILRKIRLHYRSVNCRVLTDRKWLTFVLEQLLSNALKYTPAGEITIEMPDERTLCIRDTGIGIAPEDLPRIFEWGFTGYNGRTQQKASGIGLYLCKRICDGLGHRISATARVGEGTTVTIRFAETGEKLTEL